MLSIWTSLKICCLVQLKILQRGMPTQPLLSFPFIRTTKQGAKQRESDKSFSQWQRLSYNPTDQDLR